MQVRRIDVGDEAHVEGVVMRAARWGERIADQPRAEIGAADADAHQVAQRFAAEAAQATGADALRKVADPAAFGRHLGSDFGAAADAAQRHVQGRAVLGRVHDRPGKEQCAGFIQARRARHREQGCEAFAIDSLLAEIRQHAGCFDGHRRRPLVVGQQVAKMARRKPARLLLQRPPRGARGALSFGAPLRIQLLASTKLGREHTRPPSGRRDGATPFRR
jgi:hypothetical protein